MHARDEMIDRIIDKYLGSITLARQAYMTDSQYHAEVAHLRNVMEVFDLAMEQEGLISRTRMAVLQRFFMGATEATEARKRIERMKRLSEVNQDCSGDL